MSGLEVEHHTGFTAVYFDRQLAAFVLTGTREQREAADPETWYRVATWAAEAD